MLTENDVIDAVCSHLEGEGYDIVQRCYTDQKGIDIIAVRPQSSGRLLIEAKGETSSDPRTKRYGRPFDNAQVGVHVAEAFRTAASLRVQAQGSSDSIAIALPETALHRRHVHRIKEVIDTLRIAVYFVQPDGSVKLG